MTEQFTMSMYLTKEDLYKAKCEYYEEALRKITARFEGKLSLHKEDCFAYQVAKEALGDDDDK